VLDEASEGGTFLKRFGLDRSDATVSAFGEQELSAHRYTLGLDDDAPNEPAVEVPASVVADGAERPVDRSTEIPGTEAPFFPTAVAPDSDERYGFFCSNCGSTAVAGDDLDRLECGDCANGHEADDWDGAYL